MKRIFTPFIGKNYGTSDSCFQEKVLCLGDSHYGSSTPTSNTTNDVVTRYLKNVVKESWFPTFSKGLQALTGCDMKNNLAYREKIFNSICFYNYVQVPMTEPREKPSVENYNEATEAFIETLNELTPDIVVVWGARLWNHLPWENFLEYRGCEEINGYKLYSCFYSLSSDKKILLLRIYHPSGGFSWMNWHNCLKKYIHLK